MIKLCMSFNYSKKTLCCRECVKVNIYRLYIQTFLTYISTECLVHDRSILGCGDGVHTGKYLLCCPSTCEKQQLYFSNDCREHVRRRWTCCMMENSNIV